MKKLEIKLGISLFLFFFVMLICYLIRDGLIKAPQNWGLIKYIVIAIAFSPVMIFLFRITKIENAEKKAKEKSE